jgi:hypothetical protein
VVVPSGPVVVFVDDNANRGRASPVHHRRSIWRQLADRLPGNNRMVALKLELRGERRRRIRLTGLLRKGPVLRGFSI